MTVKEIEDCVQAARAMLSGESISEDVYHKTLVQLAFDYTEIDLFQDALILLNAIPISYFLNVQEKQMIDDENYRRIGLALAEKLMAAGVVDKKDVVPDTCPALTQFKVGKA